MIRQRAGRGIGWGGSRRVASISRRQSQHMDSGMRKILLLALELGVYVWGDMVGFSAWNSLGLAFRDFAATDAGNRVLGLDVMVSGRSLK